MNRYLKYPVAFILLVVSADIQSQIRTGQIVGFNFSNMELKACGKEINAEGATGIHYGLIFSLPLNDNFSIQPGMMFTSKGSSYLIDSIDISLSPIYMEAPVNAIVTLGSNALGLTLIAGTYFSFGIGGNKIESGGEAKEIAFGSGDTKDIRHLDLGLNFGAGINIRGFLISTQYSLGLANLSPVTSTDSVMQNRVIGISLTTLFASR